MLANSTLSESAQNGKSHVAVVLGSGFSAAAGLPTTAELACKFLSPAVFLGRVDPVEQGIVDVLRDFWRDVFGYSGGPNLPSLEDHFTLLDLAANTGHQLGKKYTPRRLRAIRRFSIHNVFRLLDEIPPPSGNASFKFLDAVVRDCNPTIVTLNWDAVVEQRLGTVDYGTEVFDLNSRTGLNPNRRGLRLLKLHGSGNWLYCDNCRRLLASNRGGKDAYDRLAYIETADFELFGLPPPPEIGGRECIFCDNTLTGRLATFSYRKAFSINQFQTIWDLAFSVLREAKHWLVIGYSLPNADFEFRHLLKSAQLGRTDPLREWKCTVVLKGDQKDAAPYESFFGLGRSAIHTSGLESWLNSNFNEWAADTQR